jgi:hypothetical protein
MFEPGSQRFFLPNLPSSVQPGEGFFLRQVDKEQSFFLSGLPTAIPPPSD